MNTILRTIIATFVCLSSMPFFAQQAETTAPVSIVQLYTDSLHALSKKVKAETPKVKALTPEMYRIIGPATYYRQATANAIRIDWTPSTANTVLSESTMGAYKHNLHSTINQTLFNMYTRSPQRLRNYEDMIENETLVEAAEVVGNEKNDIDQALTNAGAIKDVADIVDNVDTDIKVTRPNFWKTTCRFSSKFTQNYFSENWYKGSNNNTNMLTMLTMTANYNDQKRISWENTLEMKLGFVTTTDDTCHNYLTNNDRLRLWSKLGVKAKKAWSYTTTLEATTQFLPSYRSNDRRKYAAFLAPLDVFLSIGMDYKPRLKNNNTLSLSLLPLSYKLRYVGDNDETIHNATNMRDRDTREDFGAKTEANARFNIVKNLTWAMRFYCFTSYEYVEAELENKLEFRFNKYISSELYTLWRFDDNRPRKYRDDNLGYFQFREYLTFGITYDF